MRYSQLRDFDISNGKGIGVSLFVQGCPFHCFNCFNSETWDFNGGKEWTEEVENEFFKFVSRPNISRVSFLGGEPLADQNVTTILHLIKKIRKEFPDKKIWLWTGFNFDKIVKERNYSDFLKEERYDVVCECDYIIDGKFMYDLRDLTLKFRGSSNQRVIDIKKTIKKGKVVTIF